MKVKELIKILNRLPDGQKELEIKFMEDCVLFKVEEFLGVAYEHIESNLENIAGKLSAEEREKIKNNPNDYQKIVLFELI